MTDTNAHPDMIPLTPAQQRHVQRLIGTLDRAEAQLEKAQAMRDTAQAAGAEFLAYCAEELRLDVSGYVFDQARMAFVWQAQDNQGEKASSE